MSVSIDLAGRVVWVTGGAGGIGAEIVTLFERAGARVVSLDAVYPPAPAGEGGRARLDLRDGDAIDETAAALCANGLQPNVLVNNAGITNDAVSWKMTNAQWDDVIGVNLTGAFRMCRACAPLLRRSAGGAIVNVTSINGLRGKFGQANYTASKAGLIGLTKTLARELGRDQVRVNAVAPGMVQSQMTDALGPEVRAQAEQETLLGRLGRPMDVAHAVLFLASPLASHITGQVLVVDGGQLV